MTRRSAPLSFTQSPVLVGAVTLLVTVVGVFISYNANAGLPFVPTYDLKAELPSGAKLLKGNDVRVGGFRVGTVERVEPGSNRDGKGTAVARLKLDKSIEPLPVDTRLRVRPRSPLGLKYLELTPGSSTTTLAPGGTVGLARTSQARELEDVFETFDEDTRNSLRAATEGLGNAVAGRGASANRAIEALSPLFRYLTPVARNLAAPQTRLGELVRQLGATGAELAPVAVQAAELLGRGADTFDALSRDPAALRETIEQTPPTLATGTRSLRALQPFAAELTDLSNQLRPAAAELPRTLPPLRRVLRVGAPVLRRSIPLSERVEAASVELRRLFANPNTLLALRDLRTALTVLRPAVRFIAPYQTVCNYANYFIHPLGEHQSQPGPGGLVQEQFVKSVNLLQPNTPASTFSARPWDLPPGQAPQGATFADQPAGRVVGPPYQPAIDDAGNADCQNGQFGYPNGRLVEPYIFPEGEGVLSDGTPRGANAAVAISDFPGLSGGTFRSRQLGIDKLEDVP